MLWLTIQLVLLFGIFSQTNGKELECSKLEKNSTKCCDKDLRCAYLDPKLLEPDDECNCLASDIRKFSTKKCADFAPLLLEDNSNNGGKTIPCNAFFKTCPPEDTSIECYNGYPPPAKVFGNLADHYCQYKREVDGTAVFAPPESVYDVFFTCWLYDCKNRLEIPQETRAKSNDLQWCFPPVLPKNDKSPKFCSLYTTEPNIYDSTVTATETSNSNQSSCVLAPICNKDGTVDKEKYMVPWNNGNADEKHCERLCKKDGPNNGKFSQEADKLESPDNKCRRIPSCGDETKYNRFQVPDCRPWCTSDSADYLKKSSNTCNPLPLCKDGADKPDAPYSENNPFGWDGECIKPAECTGDHKPETHYCTSSTDEAGGSGGPKGADSGMLWIGLGIGLGVLVLVVIGVAVYFLVFRKKKTNDPESAATSVAPSVTSNYVEPKRDGTIVGRELKEEAKKEDSDKKNKEKKDGSSKDKKEGSTKDKKEGSSKEKKSSKEKSAKEKTSAKGDATADKPKDNSKKSASKMP